MHFELHHLTLLTPLIPYSYFAIFIASDHHIFFDLFETTELVGPWILVLFDFFLFQIQILYLSITIAYYNLVGTDPFDSTYELILVLDVQQFIYHAILVIVDV